MTKEEAKKEIIDMANALQLIPNTPKGKAVSMALKALEKDSVLDKIRAEFISLYPKNFAGEPELGGLSCVFSLNEILRIIDKYKAESEG